MKTPNIFSLGGLKSAHDTRKEINGKWVACRPEGYHSFKQRIRAAWLVFTGRADAVIWPENQ